MLEIIQLPVLNDNYIYLLHEPVGGKTAVVDPALAQPVLDELQRRGWHLDFIFNTHHHSDHVGGNLALKQHSGCRILAPQADSHRIPGIDQALSDGDKIALGAVNFSILATPGHTSGHIVFYADEEQVLFCGDTLFVMGCGRLFEGSPEQMWQSLQKLRALPPQTKVYCAHEYTLANGRFALTVEPDNAVLNARMGEVKKLRSENIPTVPSTIALERATNPFFRADEASVKAAVGQPDASPLAVFTEIRKRKDKF
ncbi:MAG: hydroxyacylglutathione hydrolase [Gammaproteobacteria bacterium HGW-Gammaproteobacteria-3]|jgi:hydroxyacylglutathione hydrolase|nr:MAG: hydroxyacylglutathione hydrolase [Gammaproteobacteria bacterium HGW-Gammaproteobacteria-3]